MNLPPFLYPTLDASTFAGQMQWFMAGFIYSSVPASAALMIRFFKALGKSSPDL
jgi:hypothetical protein